MVTGSFAPVLISVYTRVSHFKKCLESLEQNQGADQTVLFIVSDGPADDESSPKVAEVRKVIREIGGFRDVNVFAPEENHNGLLKYEVLDQIRADFPSYIVTEDDNVFSPHFLNFINQGLTFFHETTSVRAICGYQYPGFPAQSNHQIYLRNFTPWGFGTWSDRPRLGSTEGLNREVLSNSEYFDLLNSSLPHLVRLNRRVIRENLIAEDVNISNSLFTQQELCVFPPGSLVRNIGNDDSGLNSKTDLRFFIQKLHTPKPSYNLDAPIRENMIGKKWISRFHGGPVASLGNYLIHFEFKWEGTWVGKLLQSFNKMVIPLFGFGPSLQRKVRNYFIRIKYYL